ncbi:MAG: hypothetical protein KGI00_05205 [Candidatus Micrarchaeota archaeon]|nr:hypothetical protein [Candidatus Micrarchaeota archaeon]MDE1850096.1 hypothetical protein [Candidatus Micrarchaeota archaeon]
MEQQPRAKGQSSFELLITLSFGLAILLPLVVVAFLQIANANTALTSAEAQQAASKIASVATLVGSEGPPAKQVVQVNIPKGVNTIYVGNTINGIGHEVIFVVVSPQGLSYVTAYTPINVSGNLSTFSNPGTYLVNVSAQPKCPSRTSLPCVYVKTVV